MLGTTLKIRLRVGREVLPSAHSPLTNSTPKGQGLSRSRPLLQPDLRSYSPRRLFTSRTSTRWLLDSLQDISERNSPLVFHSTSDNPYHNLALEHFLLTNSHPTSRLLFFYTNRPCVVVGRNQNPWLECDLKRLQAGLQSEEQEYHVERDDGLATATYNGNDNAYKIPIDLVRRRSGGGTVFHDSGNLNYSVIVPNDKEFVRRKHAEMVVRAITNMQDHGFGEVKVNERNDIVMKDAGEWLKISGSAFKLTRGRALHHGTLLYSSPNLGRISELLRSPGREFIHAKGVESVRSKVGNLRWVADIGRRTELMTQITNAIVNEFWKMYGSGKERDQEVEVKIGDHECDMQINPRVAKGVAELMTDDWRFGQTPRFEFTSGVVDGMEVKFQANHSTLERISLHPKANVSDEETGMVFVLREQHLDKVHDWANLIQTMKLADDGLEPSLQNDQLLSKLSPALLQRIASIFPFYSSRNNT